MNYTPDEFEDLKKKIRVALYARVSTGDGRQFTANQVEQMQSYAAQRPNWQIVAQYLDQGTGSRGLDQRDELAQLMQAARAKKFDLVLVFSLDRFTREGVLKAFQYVEQLTRAGVQFRSVTEEHFQTSGPAGELFMAVAAWMAKQEHDQISKRVKAGLDRARAAGKMLGRPRVGLDLTKVERLRSEGLSVRQIAAALKTSKSSVERGCRQIRKLNKVVVEIPKAG